jgi:hypothetical protein
LRNADFVGEDSKEDLGKYGRISSVLDLEREVKYPNRWSKTKTSSDIPLVPMKLVDAA